MSARRKRTTPATGPRKTGNEAGRRQLASDEASQHDEQEAIIAFASSERGSARSLVAYNFLNQRLAERERHQRYVLRIWRKLVGKFRLITEEN